MKYLNLIENLQKNSEGNIILIKNGIFFVAVGKDALQLNNEIGLKRTCMKKGLCKVGFQVKSLEKYIDAMKEKDLSFEIYDYNRETEKEELIYKNEGSNKSIGSYSVNCSECTNKPETENEVIERVKKLGQIN